MPAVITPEVADARRFEDRLQHAATHGGFLALTVRPRELRLAEQVIREHFPVECRSLEAALLREIRAVADAARVDWSVVLDADAAAPDSRDWNNLQALVRRALPQVEQGLSNERSLLLLTYPGLLARYDALGLLERLRDRAGQREGPSGVWVLVPSEDGEAMPVVDGKPVPVVTPGEWARIPDPWLRNIHRAGPQTD
jgi:hypothetical protein